MKGCLTAWQNIDLAAYAPPKIYIQTASCMHTKQRSSTTASPRNELPRLPEAGLHPTAPIWNPKL